MVGQFENSLMPWRSASSCSTLYDAKFDTPQRLRISAAVAEKPHCGNCGVPFMYSTTRLSATCFLIVSWISLMVAPDGGLGRLANSTKLRSAGRLSTVSEV